MPEFELMVVILLWALVALLIIRLPNKKERGGWDWH